MIGEQVFTKNKIEESESYHRQLIQGLPVAVYACNADGYIQFYNAAAVELWGREPEVGKDLWCGSWKIYNTDATSLGLDACPMAIALKEGRIVHTEIVIERPDGIRRHIIPHPQPVYDTNGTLTGAINTLIDITEQVTARKKIEESEVRSRLMGDMMPQIVWTARSDGYVDYYNKQWYEYTGFKNGFGDESWLPILHPDDVARCNEVYYKSIKTGEPYQIEYRFKDKNSGGYRWFLGRALPVKDKHNKIIKWIGTCTDIHEPKNLAEEVFLLEFARDFSSYKTDAEFPNSLVTYVANKTGLDYVLIAELIAEQKDSFTVKTIALTAQGKIIPGMECSLPHAPGKQVQRGTIFSYPEQCRLVFPENRTFEQFKVEGYISYPLFDHHGNVMGLVAGMHEKKIGNPHYVVALLKIVARRAEFEMERNRFNETLKATNSTLKTTVEELKRSNLQLDQFAHIASHDLQEPLRKITTFSKRLREKHRLQLPDDLKMYLDKIEDSSDRMTKLIQDLLNYSRLLNHEKLFEQTDLNKIFKNVLNDFELLIEQKKVQITYDKLPIIQAISSQMHQLFYNLISNAIKFSNEDRVPIISLESRKLPAKEIKKYKTLNPQLTWHEIIFKDNGIGFEQKYAEQIFIIFQRLNQRSQYAGTGIGLALSKKIVENHYGKIFTEAKENEGAVFHVILPASQPHVVTSGKPGR